jgi:hypothetical protein
MLFREVIPAHHENNIESTYTGCAKIQNFLMCKQAINLELPLFTYFKRRLDWYLKPVHFTHTVYSGVL